MGRKSTANVAASAATVTKKTNSKRNCNSNVNTTVDNTELVDSEEVKDANKKTRNQKSNARNTKNSNAEIHQSAISDPQEDPLTNDTIVTNGKPSRTTNRQKSNSQRVSDDEDFVPLASTSKAKIIESTINQRPRRQIKHKFIKSTTRKFEEEQPKPPTLEIKNTVGKESSRINHSNQAIDPVSSTTLVPVITRLSNQNPNPNPNVTEFRDINSTSLRRDVNQETMEPMELTVDLMTTSLEKPKKSIDAKVVRRSGRRGRPSSTVADTADDQSFRVVEEISKDDILIEVQTGEDHDVANEIELVQDNDFPEETIIEEVSDHEFIYAEDSSSQQNQEIQETVIEISDEDIEMGNLRNNCIEYSNDQENIESNAIDTKNTNHAVADILETNIALELPSDSQNSTNDSDSEDKRKTNTKHHKSRRLTKTTRYNSKDESVVDSIIIATSTEEYSDNNIHTNDEQIEISELNKNLSVITIDPQKNEKQANISNCIEYLKYNSYCVKPVENTENTIEILENKKNEEETVLKSFSEHLILHKNRLRKSNSIENDSQLHHKNNLNCSLDLTRSNLALSNTMTNKSDNNLEIEQEPSELSLAKQSDTSSGEAENKDEALISLARTELSEPPVYANTEDQLKMEDDNLENSPQSRTRRERTAKINYSMRRTYCSRKIKDSSELSVNFESTDFEETTPTRFDEQINESGASTEIIDDSQKPITVEVELPSEEIYNVVVVADGTTDGSEELATTEKNSLLNELTETLQSSEDPIKSADSREKIQEASNQVDQLPDFHTFARCKAPKTYRREKKKKMKVDAVSINDTLPEMTDYEIQMKTESDQNAETSSVSLILTEQDELINKTQPLEQSKDYEAFTEIIQNEHAVHIEISSDSKKKSVGRPRKNALKPDNVTNLVDKLKNDIVPSGFQQTAKTRRSVSKMNDERVEQTTSETETKDSEIETKEISDSNETSSSNENSSQSVPAESLLTAEDNSISIKKRRGRKKRKPENNSLDPHQAENITSRNNESSISIAENCETQIKSEIDLGETNDTVTLVPDALENEEIKTISLIENEYVESSIAVDDSTKLSNECAAISLSEEPNNDKMEIDHCNTINVVETMEVDCNPTVELQESLTGLSLKEAVNDKYVENDLAKSDTDTVSVDQAAQTDHCNQDQKQPDNINIIVSNNSSNDISTKHWQEIQENECNENSSPVPENQPIAVAEPENKTEPVPTSDTVEEASTDSNPLQDAKLTENFAESDELDLETRLLILAQEFSEELESSIRRSGRIKTINKTRKRSQGLGLVKDKEKLLQNNMLGEDDLSNASMDADFTGKSDKDGAANASDIVIPLKVKTMEELEKERIDREIGLKSFTQIVDNEYRSERIISKEAKKMLCDCFLTYTEIERGEMGCGDDCLNRMLLIECGPKCTVNDRCTNKVFQKHQNADCTIFKTEKKGFGLIANSYIPPGTFIMEYVGEVLNSKQFEKRATDYSKLMNAHYYFMALSSDCVIDATKRGNISRFINHSCDPNAETQKWTVNGELRIGFFSSKAIMPDEEITFDYQFQRYGKEAQRCFCEAENCRGWIGGEPDSDDELEEDEEEEEESEDEERADAEKMPDESDPSVLKSPDDASTAKEGKKAKAAAKVKKIKDPTKKRVKKETTKAVRTPRQYKKGIKRTEIMDDPDLDKEIDAITITGLKNQVHTLQFSRLMVRAKLLKAKSRLLLLLREGELPCRRLFLDYHGLQLIHSWMSDISSADRLLELTFRLEILQTLEILPITNKTALKDTKVLSTVQRWTKVIEYVDKALGKLPSSTNEESSPSDSGSGTPIDSNDGTSSPKADENSQTEPPIQTEKSLESVQDIQIDKPVSCENSTETPGSGDSPSEKPMVSEGSDNLDIAKQSEVLKSIPQILEQSSALKHMGLDMLKRIISTNEKNTKIIEDSERNDQLPDGESGKLIREVRLLAMKLVTTWEQLPESFKIPKKLRIEQMKEHEREADQSYKDTVQKEEPVKQSSSSRFQERFREREKTNGETADREKDPRYRRYSLNESRKSKIHRRQMFEAKIAQENAERKRSIEQITHEAKCSYFNIDPRKVEKITMPYCVHPATGQWYGEKMNPIGTPPSHAHIKPPPPAKPTDPREYNIQSIDLPDLWRYAINDKGKIYYYHAKILIPQWEPPIKLLPLMEEHTISGVDIKMESIQMDDEAEHYNDPDDEDEDVVHILNNSKINTKKLLTVKSDPVLEKYNDGDDSSSTDSDDSITHDLEMKLSCVKEKMATLWDNIKNPPNLHEEIVAMAKIDSGASASPLRLNLSQDVKDSRVNSTYESDYSVPTKKAKNRDKLVQEFRISPLSEEMKRELRRDSRRYKENKAKLRRQKEMQLKHKANHTVDAPIARKLKKITDGLPSVSKSTERNHSFSTSGTPIRFSDSSESKKSRTTAFASTASSSSPLSLSLSASASTSSSSSSSSSSHPMKKSSSSASDPPASTSLTQILVNKLPSIGHKFVADAKELIMKNTMKPIKPVPTTSSSSPSTVAKSSSSVLKSSNVHSAQQKKSSSTQIQKSSPKPQIKRKKTSDINEPLDSHSPAAKKIKDKFCSEISSVIVRYLKPYLADDCEVGRITSHDDFKHLARKLTHFVMLKELKYCKAVNVLEVTESVKVKAREYIRKYMGKFGKVYVKPENEQDCRNEDL